MPWATDVRRSPQEIAFAPQSEVAQLPIDRCPCWSPATVLDHLREELMVLVRDEMKLELLEINKMEYDWAVEFEVDEIPDWLADPYPWDWILTARASSQPPDPK